MGVASWAVAPGWSYKRCSDEDGQQCGCIGLLSKRTVLGSGCGEQPGLAELLSKEKRIQNTHERMKCLALASGC